MSNPIVAYLDRRAVTMLLLGFSAGMPNLLIFSTLSLWLSEAGVSRSMVTMFSWAALGYAFKFVWSPLIDSLPLPVLTQMLGKRRAWLLLAQVLIITAILLMASVNPQLSGSLKLMAMGAVLLGFSSATQDVVIDALRIEIAPDNSAMQTVMSSTYAAGYRLGMIVAGAGSLLLAAELGSTKANYVYEAWRNTYWIMAAVMSVGVATTLFIREPEYNRAAVTHSALTNLRLLLMFVVSVAAFVGAYVFLGSYVKQIPVPALLQETLLLLLATTSAVYVGWLTMSVNLVPKQIAVDTWVTPVSDFFQRYGNKAILLLALIGLYRISDIVAGVISNVFYADMGFSKEQIAWAVKTFGVAMSIAGGFAGGVLAQKFRIMNMMMLGAIAAASTNLLFMLLAMTGNNAPMMYFAVGVDNFAGGLATTVFIVFLSSLTNIKFTAVQYALLSSLMTLSPKILGGYSGSMVDNMGYPTFFLLTACMGIPILWLIWLADKKLYRQ